MDRLILPPKRTRTKKPVVRGIYQFLQISTGKKYIGSSNNVEQRRRNHINRLNKQKHDNRHFSFAWDKNGEADFVFSILEVVEDESQLIAREQWYLDNFIQHGFDFNHCMIASHPPVHYGKRKWVASEETRRKISESKRGRKTGPLTPEQNLAKAERQRGRKRPPETLARMSAAMKGKKHSAESREKMSADRTGKKRPPWSDEAMKRIKEAAVRRSARYKEEGRTMSEETKQMLAEARRRHREKRIEEGKQNGKN